MFQSLSLDNSYVEIKTSAISMLPEEICRKGGLLYTLPIRVSIIRDFGSAFFPSPCFGELCAAWEASLCSSSSSQ